MNTSKNIESRKLTKAELQNKAKALNIHYDSDAMSEVMYKAITAAKSDTDVLITGASGVGKERVTEAIHKWSNRADKILKDVDCGVKADSGVLESELFGHEKGAFTGAIAQHRGVFEQADGGTIFLDEIGNLDRPSQIKLLRVLQERSFTRMGGDKKITVDVRVIAATNEDLEQAIKDGKFREDLHARLNRFPIHIPPLRERREDIPPLIKHFIEASNAKHGTTVTGTTDEIYERLLNAYWGMNVRELESAINAAVLMSKNDGSELLEPSHFLHDITSPQTKRGKQAEDHSTDALNLVMQKQDVTLDDLEQADKNLDEEVLYTLDALITRKIAPLSKLDQENREEYVSRGRINTFVTACWKCFFPEETKKPSTGDFIKKCQAVWKTAAGS